MGHVSLLEVLATAAAGLGTLMTLAAKVGADLNLIAVRRKGLDGSRILIAQHNVRTENTLLTVQLIMFHVGFATLFLAPPPFSPTPDALGVQAIRSLIITRLGMSAVSFLLMYLSYRSWLESRLPAWTVTRRSDLSGAQTLVTTLPIKDQLIAIKAQIAVEAAETSVEQAHAVSDAVTDAAAETKGAL